MLPSAAATLTRTEAELLLLINHPVINMAGRTTPTLRHLQEHAFRCVMHWVSRRWSHLKMGKRSWAKSHLSAGINPWAPLPAEHQTCSHGQGRRRMLQASSKPPLKTKVLLIFIWELSPHYPPDRMGADSIRNAGLHTSPRGMSFSSAAAPRRRGRHTSTSSQTPSL